jgi:hypothetical protein
VNRWNAARRHSCPPKQSAQFRASTVLQIQAIDRYNGPLDRALERDETVPLFVPSVSARSTLVPRSSAGMHGNGVAL